MKDVLELSPYYLRDGSNLSELLPLAWYLVTNLSKVAAISSKYVTNLSKSKKIAILSSPEGIDNPVLKEVPPHISPQYRVLVAAIIDDLSLEVVLDNEID